jgi:redox-sensitive bicupin YhaK (pirin superfamily)
MTLKTILGVHDAHRDDIADLVTRRPVPGPRLQQVDPFLFLNHHGPQVYPPGSSGLPFGPHPHRGFETVTFILDGELTHKDSAGHESSIYAGGVQWMTAGSGLVHAEISSEEFKKKGGPLEILQLWVNLPPSLKMTAPRYVGLQKAAIPEVSTPDGEGTVHLISGDWSGVRGPIESLTGIVMTTVDLKAGGKLDVPSLAGRAVFLYVARGAIAVNGQAVGQHKLVQLDIPGDAVAIEAREDALLLFGHGEPIGAPVVAYGPFVMNTREEIVAAIHDYQAGKFGGAPA